VSGGATFNSNIAVNGGNITTGGSTGTLYDTNASYISIGATADTVEVSRNKRNSTLGIGQDCKFKTRRTETSLGFTGTQQIFSYRSYSTGAPTEGLFAELLVTAEVITDESGSGGSQITKILVCPYIVYGNTADHVEYGNAVLGGVGLTGNIANYSIGLSGEVGVDNDIHIVLNASMNQPYFSTNADSKTIFKVLATMIQGEGALV
jgi:hypothetical protein